jgi:hypothetical protein
VVLAVMVQQVMQAQLQLQEQQELEQLLGQMELQLHQPGRAVRVVLERILLRATPTWQIAHSYHHMQ